MTGDPAGRPRTRANPGRPRPPPAGILSRDPDGIGIPNEATQEEFGEVLRTLHAGAGCLTVIACPVAF